MTAFAAIAFDPETFAGGLARGDRDALLSSVRVQRYVPGATIIAEGATDARVALLLTGRVKLEAHGTSGRRVLLGLRGPGELLGELRAYDGGARGAAVHALDHVAAGMLPIPEFRELVTRRPAIADALLRMLAGRLRESDRGRLELGTRSANERIAGCLIELARLCGAQRDDGRVEFRNPLTQEELGMWSGLSRQATARALHELRAEGLVDNAGRLIRLLDTTALRRRAAG